MTHSDKRAYFFKIDTTVKRVRNYMQKQLSAAGIDLTVDQWVVLDHIYPSPGISQNDLAQATAKDAPTTTRILDILIKKGWVERKMARLDRRKSMIFLTSEGTALHERAFPIVAEVRRKSWENLSDEDFDTLVGIMDTIYGNLEIL
ncbi:MarR family transcriptional regulator [Marinilongibacter aquaticus]|uniref:MarR family winged helix-turn-helix transcriptional regulator n=1 Tax=Marinilongibacter aquaticus TaxID=2975157 RepID=UPI0021BD3744|nr:MarR family transcriptional regulator [Marinilongibacter aquaticus]UBM60135.1 MarR family transcriptional regulator [Marinilongibacter aquaticus]